MNLTALDIFVDVTTWRFRDAQIRKLELPGAQHVRLHLRQLADLAGLEPGSLLRVGRRLGHRYHDSEPRGRSAVDSEV